MTKKPIALLFCITALIVGCKQNGIEGDVKIYKSDKPVPGIRVQAVTNTDIKEEQSKANRFGTSDMTGHFRISGLLPLKKYRITVADDGYVADAVVETAPEKGTRISGDSLFACPSPPSDGIWFFNIDNGKFEQVDRTDAPRLSPRVHMGMLPGMWSRNNAYSISDNDALKVSVAIPHAGLIILKGKAAEDIARLYHINRKNIQNRYIEGGWYFNISNFYFDGMLGITPNIQELQLGSIFKQGGISAIPVENLAEGLYFFTTKTALLQRSALRGNLNQPQEGYLVRVGTAQAQATADTTEIAPEGSSPGFEATRAVKEARDAYMQAKGLLSGFTNAPEPDLSALKADLAGLETAIESCRELLKNGTYTDAKDKAEAILEKANAISDQIQKAANQPSGQSSKQIYALLESYFDAVKQNDNDAMSSLALEPFQPDLRTWKVVTIGKEDVEPAKLPELAKAEMEAKRAQDAQIGPTLDADSALRAAPPGRVSELRTKYEMENAKMQELKRAYNAAKAAAAMEEEMTLFSLGVREMQSVREFGGTVHTRKVEVAITTSQGNTRSYNILMRRYLLQGPTLSREGRWVIIRFEPV